jgi:hypothetical protein
MLARGSGCAYARPVTRWSGLLALCCLMLGGCHQTLGGKEIATKHDGALFVSDSRLVLIDSRSELERVGSPPVQPRIIGYDVPSGRERWQTLVPAPYLDASENGQFGVVLEPSGTGQLRVSALDLEHGKLRGLAAVPADPYKLRARREMTALSNDGTYLASVLDGQLSVWETTTAGPLLSQQRFADERAVAVLFQGDSTDLLVQLKRSPDDKDSSLVAFARQDLAWRQVRRFDGVHSYAWTPRGLLFTSARGLARYDRGAESVLVAGLDPAVVRYAADGRHVGYKTPQGQLNVYDLDTKRVVLVAPWQGHLRLYGQRATAMTGGVLWRADLASGSSKTLRDFGPSTSSHDVPLLGGSGLTVNYGSALSEHGTYLYYVEPQQHRAWIYEVDRL